MQTQLKLVLAVVLAASALMAHAEDKNQAGDASTSAPARRPWRSAIHRTNLLRPPAGCMGSGMGMSGAKGGMGMGDGMMDMMMKMMDQQSSMMDMPMKQ